MFEKNSLKIKQIIRCIKKTSANRINTYKQENLDLNR